MVKKIREVHLNAPYLHFKGKFYRPTHIYDLTKSSTGKNTCKLKDYKDIEKDYVKYNQRCMNCENDEYVTVYFHRWNSKLKHYNSDVLIFDKKDNLIIGNYVLYIPLYENKDAEMFIRDYNEFLSPVDKNKYPNVNQKWRFEYSGPQNYSMIE